MSAGEVHSLGMSSSESWGSALIRNGEEEVSCGMGEFPEMRKAELSHKVSLGCLLKLPFSGWPPRPPSFQGHSFPEQGHGFFKCSPGGRGGQRTGRQLPPWVLDLGAVAGPIGSPGARMYPVHSCTEGGLLL